MTALEIVLLIGGILCIAASFMIGQKEQPPGERQAGPAELTPQQQAQLTAQITEMIDDQLKNLSERTEAQLDKISNTKILEMNDFAENIISEINRNHNETVFLYDMLNEKAKEVKNTVKDVNLTKKQVEQLRADSQSEDTEETAEPEAAIAKQESSASRDMAKERLVELVRQSNARARTDGNSRVRNAQANDLVAQQNELKETEAAVMQQAGAAPEPEKPAKRPAKPKSAGRAGTKKAASDKKDTPAAAPQAAQMNIQFDKNANNNDRILALYHQGMNNKEIAKELNLGIGEVKLVIDLFNSGRS